MLCVAQPTTWQTKWMSSIFTEKTERKHMAISPAKLSKAKWEWWILQEKAGNIGSTAVAWEKQNLPRGTEDDEKPPIVSQAKPDISPKGDPFN